MKNKLCWSFLIVFLFLGLTTSAVQANQIINFVNSEGKYLQGVDGNTSSWSVNSATVNLRVNEWNLLNGAATLYTNGLQLSHRGTQGIGIWGGERDEINGNEIATIAFNSTVNLNSFQVRSLFADDLLMWDERGGAKLFLEGDLVHTESLTGTQNGLLAVDYSNPYRIDKIEFFVPKLSLMSPFSEFALANLDVTTTPEPIGTSLFLLGGLSMAMSAYRKKKLQQTV